MNTLQEEILTGLMLGDGFLEKHKNGKNACLRITRNINDYRYLKYHESIFHEYYNVSCTVGKTYDKRTNKNYHRCLFRTKVHPELTKLWNEWYHNGKKIVPHHIVITPLTLATWFADDGSITVKKRQYTVKLSTHGFTYDETAFLQNTLLTKFGLKFKIYEDKSGTFPHWFLMLTSKKEVRNFTRLINSVFPSGMERKSNVWRNNQSLLEDVIYPTCKFCHSKNVYKNGSDRTKKQKYLCKNCNKQFT